jgi:hypothetical protein
MTRIWIFLCSFGLPLLSFAQSHPINGTTPSKLELIALVHASIMQSDGSVLTNANLLLSGDKILALGKNITIPSEALVYDLNWNQKATHREKRFNTSRRRISNSNNLKNMKSNAIN